jgi:hypothetical protein
MSKKIDTKNDENKTNIIEKKRGRPPKFVSSPQPKPKPIVEVPDSNEEIILHLKHTPQNLVNDVQRFTNFNTDSMTNFNIEPVNNNSNIISDPNELILSESSGNQCTDINYLIDEIHRRDIIIKELRESLKYIKNVSQDNFLTVTKENKKTLINMGLINFKDNKLIIADTTNICCWWCTYNFETLPCFLPEKFTNNKYYVFGVFCSFSCMFAYNEDMNDFRKQTRNSLINKLYKDIFGFDCNIKHAGPREILEKFGGVVKIETFRDSKSICNKIHKINIPPTIPLLSYYEESILDKN